MPNLHRLPPVNCLSPGQLGPFYWTSSLDTTKAVEPPRAYSSGATPTTNYSHRYSSLWSCLQLHCTLLPTFLIWDSSPSHFRGGSRGGPGVPPRPPKMRPQHQNSTKLRPQNGSFRPVTIWPPLIKSWIRPCTCPCYKHISVFYFMRYTFRGNFGRLRLSLHRDGYFW